MMKEYSQEKTLGLRGGSPGKNCPWHEKLRFTLGDLGYIWPKARLGLDATFLELQRTDVLQPLVSVAKLRRLAFVCSSTISEALCHLYWK